MPRIGAYIQISATTFVRERNDYTMKIIHQHPQNQTEEMRHQNLLQLHKSCVHLMRAFSQQYIPHKEELSLSEERRF